MEDERKKTDSEWRTEEGLANAKKIRAEYRRKTRKAITLDVPKGKKEEYKIIAQSLGISLAEFIRNSLDEKIRLENLPTREMLNFPQR